MYICIYVYMYICIYVYMYILRPSQEFLHCNTGTCPYLRLQRYTKQAHGLHGPFGFILAFGFSTWVDGSKPNLYGGW